MIKYWFQIINGDANTLIHIAYMERSAEAH